MGGRIMSDGSNENDLKVVNIKSMQEFLGGVGEDDTFESLFNRTVAKVDDMIEADKQTKLAEQLAEQLAVENQSKAKSVEEIVESIIVTINNLPMEGRMQLYARLVPKETPIETPNANIKKAGRPKKA